MLHLKALVQDKYCFTVRKYSINIILNNISCSNETDFYSIYYLIYNLFIYVPYVPLIHRKISKKFYS